MLKRLKLINAIGDAVIPILGLLFFDWGLYFILLFYFIDLIAVEIFVYIKVNKIIKYQRIRFAHSLRYGRLIINSLLVLIFLSLAHLAVSFIVPQIHYIEEGINFFNYEDGLPIPQGYLLIPLVLLANFQQYKMFFIKTGIYRKISWKNLILSRRKALLFANAGNLLGIIVASIIQLPEAVYVVAIIVLKGFYDLRISKEMEV